MMDQTQRRRRRKEFVARLEKGEHIDDLADEYGYSHQYAQAIARDAGHRKTRYKSWYFHAIARVQQGESLSCIARDMGYSRQAVHEVISYAREAGVILDFATSEDTPEETP